MFAIMKISYQSKYTERTDHPASCSEFFRNFWSHQTTRSNSQPDFLRTFLRIPTSRDLHPNCPWLVVGESTALHVAAGHGQLRAVEKLLAYGASTDSICNHGSTPLHHAALSGFVDCAQTLLKHGAKKKAFDYSLWTPFMIACMHGQIETSNLLFDSETDINMLDVHKQTALHLATKGDSDIETFINLLHLGWDPYAKDLHGQSALFCALSNPSQAAYICASGLDLDPGERPVAIRNFLRQRPASKRLAIFCRRYKEHVRDYFLNPPEDCYRFSLCEAAIEDSQQAIDIFLDTIGCVASTDMDTLNSHLDEALEKACQTDRISPFVSLVRRMTLIDSTRNVENMITFKISRNNQSILDWLIIGRYIDQRKITNKLAHPEIRAKHQKLWSGIRQIQVPLTGQFARQNGTCLLDVAIYWRRRRHHWEKLVPLNWDPVAHFTPTIEEIRSSPM